MVILFLRKYEKGMNIFIIALGLGGLWVGTRWILDGALALADKFGLNHSFVGLAILAVGTDLPEVFVSIKASILHLNGTDASGIIVGNALGSGISQITFIMGASALLLNVKMERKELIRDGATLLLALVVLFLVCRDQFIDRLEGFLLLASYLLYYIVLLRTKSHPATDAASEKKMLTRTVLGLFLLGFGLLLASSHIVVEHAMKLATDWDVAQSFIGSAVIGVGTSLPELAVTIGAAIRKSVGMSVGNIIGSNIFDSLVPIGLGGIISTASVNKTLIQYEWTFLLFCTTLVITLLFTRQGISRIWGLLLIGLFILYLALGLVIESRN